MGDGDSLLDLNLYFTLHTLEDFTPTLDRLFSMSDIVAVEEAVSELAQYRETNYNRLSTGQITVEYAMEAMPSESYSEYGFQPVDPAFDRRFFGMIANCRKQICVERSPFKTRAEFVRFDSSWRPPTKTPLDRGFVTEYLLSYGNYLRNWTARLVVRDRQCALQLSELSRRNPESHILVLRGVTHQRTLERFLTEQGLRFTSYLCDARAHCMLNSELLQKLALGLQVSRRELLMCAVQVFEIHGLVDGPTMDNAAMTYKAVSDMANVELEARLITHLMCA